METFGDIAWPHGHLVTHFCFGFGDTWNASCFLLCRLPNHLLNVSVWYLIFCALLGSSISFNTAGSQIFTSVSCQWMETGRSLEYDPRFFWAIMSCLAALAGWLLNLTVVVLWEELGTLWSPWSSHPCDLRGCLVTQLYCRVNLWDAHKSPLGPSCFSSQCHPSDAGWDGLVLILQLGKPFVVFHSGMSNFFLGLSGRSMRKSDITSQIVSHWFLGCV